MIADIIQWTIITGLGGLSVYHFGRVALGLLGIQCDALAKLTKSPRSARVVPSAPETQHGDVRVEVSWVKRGVEHKVFYEGIYTAVRHVSTGEWLIWGDEKRVDRAIWRHQREMRAKRQDR